MRDYKNPAVVHLRSRPCNICCFKQIILLEDCFFNRKKNKIKFCFKLKTNLFQNQTQLLNLFKDQIINPTGTSELH